jgi:putative transposase
VVLDWATRRVLSWRLSITMEAAFCVETLEDALADNGIAISMDGKGAWRDNVFVERLWKSVKYEEVYLRAYETVGEARARLVDISTFTTGDDRIRALTTAPRIKPTSIFLRSARRPNPGTRSTYRRGIIVQITGTGSVAFFAARTAAAVKATMRSGLDRTRSAASDESRSR